MADLNETEAQAERDKQNAEQAAKDAAEAQSALEKSGNAIDPATAGQDQPTAEQAQAQEDSTRLLDKATGVLGTDQSQEKLDTEQAVGYRGHNPSPVPNEAYTVAGVTRGDPTPETHRHLRDAARDRADIDYHFANEANEAKKGGK